MIDQLGPYKLIRELARGGMGAVYEAEHETTGVHYALKTILPGPGRSLEEEGLARFLREVRVMAMLNHPHVVRIHAAESGGPAPFLVQALLPGGTLHDRLAAGLIPVDEAVEIVIKLARGLEQVHALDVLHRDLKPKNVMFDERGEPVLVDFGLALLTRAARLTETGTIMGTPVYMAPEQARPRESW